MESPNLIRLLRKSHRWRFIRQAEVIIYIKQKQSLKIMRFPQKFQEFLNLLSIDDNYLRVIRNAKKIYTIDENELKNLTPSNILQLLQKQNSKSEKEFQQGPSSPAVNNKRYETFWHPNEFKLFSWISVCYAAANNREISQFTARDLQFLSTVFEHKTPPFLEYQLQGLLKGDRKKEQWTEQEIDLLREIIKEERFRGKWSDISFALFERSGKKIFRSSHQCREKWFNHLNPVVNHQKWTLDEDILLFRLISKLGLKWAQISKAMEGVRTEHMVKNRFNSLNKKYQSRFHRFSMKKMVENILKDLVVKANSRKNDVLEIQKNMTKEGFPPFLSENELPSKLISSQTAEQCDKISGENEYKEEINSIEEEHQLQEWVLSKNEQKVELIDYVSIQFMDEPQMLLFE